MPYRMAIEKLKNDLVVMGEMCEHALASAVMALVDRDNDLAYYVIDYDKSIDEKELELNRLCIDIMGHGSLAGHELRLVSAATKINNDLERIGDLAVEICNHVLFLVGERSVMPQIIDFHSMLDQTSQMIRESISAVLEADTDLAWKIIDERQIVDDEYQIVLRELLDVMKKDSRTIERCCHILNVSKCLHRVSDQASNIAEEVLFTEEGVIVRHHLQEYHPIEPMPFGDLPGTELEKVESTLLRGRKSHEQAREEYKEAKRHSKIISKSEFSAAAAAGASKMKKAREKLLKMRQKK